MPRWLLYVGRGVLIVVVVATVVGKILRPASCLAYIEALWGNESVVVEGAYVLTIGMETGVAASMIVDFSERWPYLIAGVFFVASAATGGYATAMDLSSPVRCSGGIVEAIGLRAVAQSLLLAVVAFWMAYEVRERRRNPLTRNK